MDKNLSSRGYASRFRPGYIIRIGIGYFESKVIEAMPRSAGNEIAPFRGAAVSGPAFRTDGVLPERDRVSLDHDITPEKQQFAFCLEHKDTIYPGQFLRRASVSDNGKTDHQEECEPKTVKSSQSSAGFVCRRLGLALLCFLALSVPAQADDLIGVPGLYETYHEDTLPDIAIGFDLGFVEMLEANPGIDPWLPGAGKQLLLPTWHILPDAPRKGIVINVAELRLYYFPPDGSDPLTFPLGIGGEGKETPIGTTRIIRKKEHPTWIPTASEHLESPDLPKLVPPGPDNPMGEYALYLGWRGYAVHGTNKIYSIGRRDSHGCIRLYPKDIERLFSLVSVGTQVTVVDQPIKAGWSGGELYIEVHHPQADVDVLEQGGTPVSKEVPDIDDVVARTAGDAIDRVDWDLVERAQRERTGMPLQISRPAGTPAR